MVRTPARPEWLRPTIVGTALLAVLSGAAAFGVTAVLGDVAIAFGEATDSEVAESVGMSATTLGVGLALIRLAGAGSLWGASLADRLGRRRTLIGSVSLGLVLTLAAALMPTYWSFVVIIALARPALSTTNALSVVVAAEETRMAGRTWAIAFVGAAYALGSGLISLLRGVFDGMGFRLVLAVAALPVVLVPLLARNIEEPPAARRQVAPGRARIRLGGLPRDLMPLVLKICVLAAAISLVTGPAFSYLFVYGENVLGVSPGYMAMLVLGAGASGMVGLLVGRAAADRIGRRATAAFSTVAVCGAGIIAYSGSVVSFTVGYLVAIAASAAFGPATGALVNEAVPTRYRGTTNGWAAAAGVVGAVAGLALFGIVSDAVEGFGTAARILWLPVLPVTLLYARLPETLGTVMEGEEELT